MSNEMFSISRSKHLVFPLKCRAALKIELRVCVCVCVDLLIESICPKCLLCSQLSDTYIDSYALKTIYKIILLSSVYHL